jgi:hypothetical protein
VPRPDSKELPERADLDRLVRRLRAFSPEAVAARRGPISELLVALADLTAPGRHLPDLPDHALADAIAVLGHDALADDRARAALGGLLTAALDRTR